MLSQYADVLGTITMVLGAVFVLTTVGMIQKNAQERRCTQPDSWLVIGTLFHFFNILFGIAIDKRPVWVVSALGLFIMIVLDVQRFAYGTTPRDTRDSYGRNLDDDEDWGDNDYGYDEDAEVRNLCR